MKKIALIIATIALLSGCQTLATKKHSQSFEQQFSNGQFKQASETALLAGSIDPQGKSNSLLWSLQAGTALTASDQYLFSNSVLDGAEALMKADDTKNIGQKGLQKVTTILLNSSFNDYNPTVFDGVMVNTYKAVNNLFLQDMQNARIEFNRAADRQRRAKEHFKDKIKEQGKKLAEQKNERAKKTAKKTPATGFSYDKSFSESEKSIYEKYPELKNWKAYPDFVNPYTDYLHGLYFFLASQNNSDFGKARQSLRRVAGMVPKNKAIATDLKVVNNLRRGVWQKNKLSPTTWVIYENGLAPLVEETVIPLPLFLVSGKVDYAQIALPKLKVRDSSYPYLDVFSGKKKLGRTQLLASMDRVVQTEFKKEFPYKVTEAVASTLTKALIQYELKKRGGLAGSLAGALYQATTTHADTRSWSTLPKEVQVARVRKPKNNQLVINAPGLKTPLKIELPKNKFSILFIKANEAGIPTYKVVGFDA